MPGVALLLGVMAYFFRCVECQMPRRFGENVHDGAARCLAFSREKNDNIDSFPQRKLRTDDFDTASRLNNSNLSQRGLHNFSLSKLSQRGGFRWLPRLPSIVYESASCLSASTACGTLCFDAMVKSERAPAVSPISYLAMPRLRYAPYRRGLYLSAML